MRKLNRDFFKEPTLRVAKNLLGKVIVRKTKNKTIKAVITETEAYVGQNDLACHAHRGRTKRSEVLFWEAGHAYVYLIYGMHYCFNVVTEHKDYPSAVLIRGVKVTEGNDKKKINLNPPNVIRINGPGRVCRALSIDKKFHAQDLISNKELWFEFDGKKTDPLKIKSGSRIGVEYAGSWSKKPWRFWTE